jgi:TPP-dependent pyruvate/acetoin dehydrogenase alpha subunit
MQHPTIPPRDISLRLLRKMREIRQLQERIITIYPTDVMVTPVHLHIGQEAVPVGVCAHLATADKIFFGHRSHGPALAKGMDMKKLVAELYGRTTGCARGYGGSMHLVDVPNGMLGSSSIVGGSIALGVGSALAAKLTGSDWISVSCFGDGAMDAGVFWESINFAALKRVPVLLVCEDNALSNVMPKSEHLFVEIENVARQFMPVACADGTDVLSVYHAAAQATDYVRSNRAPMFLRCTTKRWMKHQGVEVDDLAYNPVDRARDCPIKKLEDTLRENQIVSSDEIQEMIAAVEAEIDEAIEFSLNSPFPNESDLVREV